MATNESTHDGSSTTTEPTTSATATEIEPTTHTVTLPTIGSIVGGKDDEPMIVFNHPGETASEYTFVEHGEEKTLTEAHGCPPNSPVVETVYMESLDRSISGWRDAYTEKDGEEFVEWVNDYCSEWGISDKVLKRYGYSTRALHDVADTVEVEIQLSR